LTFKSTILDSTQRGGVHKTDAKLRSDVTLMQTLHGKGSTGCENSDSNLHGIISRSGKEIFCVYKIHIDYIID